MVDENFSIPEATAFIEGERTQQGGVEQGNTPATNLKMCPNIKILKAVENEECGIFCVSKYRFHALLNFFDYRVFEGF